MPRMIRLPHPINPQQLQDTARHLDPVSLKLRVSSASVVAAVDVPTVTLPDGVATSSDVMSQSHEKPCEVVAPLSAVDRTSIQAVMPLDDATWRTFDARKKRTS